MLLIFSRKESVQCRRNPKSHSSPPIGLDKGLPTPHHKKQATCYEMLHSVLELAGSCEHGNELLGSIKGGNF